MNVHLFNPALTSVPITDKPGSWFFPAKCLKTPVKEWTCIFT